MDTAFEDYMTNNPDRYNSYDSMANSASQKLRQINMMETEKKIAFHRLYK